MATSIPSLAHKRPPLSEETLRELLALTDSELINLLTSYWHAALHEVYAEWQVTEKGSFWVDFRNHQGRRLFLPREAGRPMAVLQGAPKQPLVPGQYYQVTARLSSLATRQKYRKPFALEVPAAAVTVLTEEIQHAMQAEKEAEQMRRTQQSVGSETANGAAPDIASNSLVQRRFAQVAPPREWRERKVEIVAALAKRSNLGEWGNGFAARTLSKISTRLATASDRMFWELLQNADDKPTASKHPPTATFHLLPNYLLFLHNGQPFSLADVEGIADAGNGTKPEEENMTGYKGIGFKSVFATSRAVHILSGGYSFRFQPEPDEDPSTVPWMVWPRWTELAQYPEELLRHDAFFQSIASSVAIGLEMGSEQMERYGTLLPQTFAQPIFLLFLRAVRTVRIEGLPTPLHLRRLDQPEGLVELWTNQQKMTYWRQDFTVEVPAEEHEAAQIDEQMPASLQRAQRVQLTLAVPLTADGPQSVAASDSILYCFLPTTDNSFAFPALVNGDFLTDPSREKVLPEKRWNNFLFQELGSVWPRWLASMLVREPQWAGAIYRLLPVGFSGKLDQNQAAFNEGLAQAVAKTCFILTATGELVEPAAAILDEAELAMVLPDLYAANLTEDSQLVHPAANTLSPAQIRLLGLKKITLVNVLALLGKATVLGYSPAAAAVLLRHLYAHKSEALLVALKTVGWLFDQDNKPMAPNGAGQFGMVDEQPDAALPYRASFRYLHPDIQAVLRPDGTLREWFEREFPALKPLNRAAALAGLGQKLAAGQVANTDAVAVASYLFGLHTAKELASVGDAKVLGRLPVRTKTGTWVNVTQAYLPDFYQPAYPLEALISEVGGSKFGFIAEEYCSHEAAAAWGIFWSKLGVKKPEAAELLTHDFLPLLKANQLTDIAHDALARFAIKLYAQTKPGVLDAEWPKLGALRLMTVGGKRQVLTQCVVADSYPAVSELVDQLLPQGLPELLAPDYAAVPQVQSAVVRKFLADASGRAASSAEGVTYLALGHLSNAGAPKDEAESVRVVQHLAALAADGKLATGLKPLLRNLLLFQKDKTQQAAAGCYLATEYGPALDIEKISGGQEQAVVSAAYLADNQQAAAVRSFLTEWLGVREKFEPEWYPELKLSSTTGNPTWQPYWKFVKTQTATLTSQEIKFSNLLVINHLHLAKTAEVAKHLAAALAAQWLGKPEVFPPASYQISGKSPVVLSPWAGPPRIYLRGPSGQSPKVGDRHLSKRLAESAPKSSWVAIHSFGSPELERYLGLQTELSLAEQLEAFAAQSEELQSAPLTKSTSLEFEKLATPLLAHFKDEVKGQDLSAWRAKLRWPAADGSWRQLTELHWLAADVVKQYYAEDRPQLMRRTKGLITELRNFCLALKVSVVQAADFKPVPPPDGGRSHTPLLQRRAADNHLLRLLVYRQFGYDEPDILARFEQELAKLEFIEVPTIKLECTRIPGFVVPVEERYQVDDAKGIFYFSGSLFTGWRHLPALGRFLEQRISANAAGQMMVDILQAHDNAAVRESLVEAGWAVPDWLVTPQAQPTPAQQTQAQTPPKSAETVTKPQQAPEPTSYDNDNISTGRGDGGAHALYNPGVSAEKRKDYQKEAREAAGPWLREHGYTVADNAHDGYSTFETVIEAKEGTTWRVVVKSYRSGILYLNPNEWLKLAGENSFLLLYKPRPGQAASEAMERITSLDEVHQRNPNVIVRLENKDVAGSVVNLTKLAEAYLYSNTFKFIFDSPSNEAFDFELAGNHTSSGPLPLDDLSIDLS